MITIVSTNDGCASAEPNRTLRSDVILKRFMRASVHYLWRVYEDQKGPYTLKCIWLIVLSVSSECGLVIVTSRDVYI